MNLSPKDLYRILSQDDKSDTETPELAQMFLDFYKDILESGHGDESDKNGTYDLYRRIVYGFNEQGFIAGFNTAVSLLFKSSG